MKKFLKKITPLLVIVAVAVAAGTYFFGQNLNSIQDLDSPQATSQDTRNTAASNELSNQPFYELTIPYLQERQYSSQLDRSDLISSNNNYSSYLASYQSDGLNINGLLTIPQGNQPEGGWPAVVFIHGYIPPNQYQTTENYQSYVDYLARNDLVVFKIDLRGHGQSEGSPSGAYFSSDYIIDTLNARAALAGTDYINADSIGLWGHSMAGNVVLRSLAAQPDIPAAVIWAGAVYTYQDMQDYGIQDNSYQRPDEDSQRRQERNQLFAEHDRSNLETQFWQNVIPTNFLDQLENPVQLHHAANDPVVTIEYSRNLSRLLEKAGINHQLFEYSSGGHNLTGISFNSAMQRTVDFFQEEL